MSRAIRQVTLALVCLLSTGALRAEQATPIAAVKAELQALLAALNAAGAAHDRAALERIYADDFLFVHALGVPANTTQQIAAAMAAPPGAALPIPGFDGLLVYGDVAILRSPTPARFGTSIDVRRNGQWQVPYFP
jgi:ketosteroid isomerase-like protein